MVVISLPSANESADLQRAVFWLTICGSHPSRTACNAVWLDLTSAE